MSETSDLQNVRFTKRQVYKTPGLQNAHKTSGFKSPVSKRPKRQIYKTSGLQNARSSKRSVAKRLTVRKYIYNVPVRKVNINMSKEPLLCALSFPKYQQIRGTMD